MTDEEAAKANEAWDEVCEEIVKVFSDKTIIDTI